jgi:glucose-6-phosphate 1-dehydrogenase
MPAIYNLGLSLSLPSGFAVVGVARRDKTNDQFRAEMKEGVAQFSRRKPIDSAVWEDFERGVSYVQGPFGETQTYVDLKKHLEELDKERGTRGVRDHRPEAQGQRARLRRGHGAERRTVDARHHREAVR